jgi:misacylated tRNA(Ala) deacylase
MAATLPLFRDDPYLRSTGAEVLAVDESGIVLDRTIFYATSGGQPGDTGKLIAESTPQTITGTVYSDDRATILHRIEQAGSAIRAGMSVSLELDWERRHRHMRMHSALHLLCSLISFPVTGGSIGAEESRLDFDIADADAIDRERITQELNALVAADHPITTRWITDEELADNPGLVRTMSVKPPAGTGRVRLVAIGVDGAVDLQPCGGTHVRSTGEIGSVHISKIEKKGRQNRRIRLAFGDAP